MPCEEASSPLPVSLGKHFGIFSRIHPMGFGQPVFDSGYPDSMWSPIGWLKSRNECCNLSIGL